MGGEREARGPGVLPGWRGGLRWEISRQTVWGQLGTVIKFRLSQLEQTSEVTSPPPHFIVGETEVSVHGLARGHTKAMSRAQVQIFIWLKSDGCLLLRPSMGRFSKALGNQGNFPDVSTLQPLPLPH